MGARSGIILGARKRTYKSPIRARTAPGTKKSKNWIGGKFRSETTPATNRLVEEPIRVVIPPSIEAKLRGISLLNVTNLHGVKIKESNIREKYNLIVVGLVNGDGSYEINPDPDEKLQQSHTLMLMGQKDKLEYFKADYRKG